MKKTKETNKKVKGKTRKDFIATCEKVNKYLNSQFKDYETNDVAIFLDILKTQSIFSNIDIVEEKVDELDEAIGRAFENIKKRFEENEKEVKKLKELKK